MVESLMRATARILIRDGYEALTTNGVAQEAGASVGSLYQYFSSKEALVAALLDQHVERTMELLRAQMPSLLLLPLHEAVPRFLQVMIEAHHIDPKLHRVFVEQLPRIGQFAKMEATLEECLAMAEIYLRAHAAEIGPQNHQLSAFLLVNVIEALTHAAVQSRPALLSTPEFATELARMILGYLDQRPARSAPHSKLRSRARA
jgi:AcrR family transcriptional regulator